MVPCFLYPFSYPTTTATTTNDQYDAEASETDDPEDGDWKVYPYDVAWGTPPEHYLGDSTRNKVRWAYAKKYGVPYFKVAAYRC